MEIVDYLSVARQRLWILIGIPVLAVAATVAYQIHGSTMYSATAEVTSTALVGGPTSSFTGPQAASQFVAAFSASAKGPAVLSAVSKDVGVSSQQLDSGLTVSQVGLSSNMSVHFQGASMSKVAPVLHAVVTETLTSMFGSQVTLAAQQVTAAKKAVATANQELVDFGKKYGAADPTFAYQAQLSHLNFLLQRQAVSRDAGHILAAAGMEPYIAATRSKLAEFTTVIPEYTNLTATQQSAINDLSTAQNSYRAAQAQIFVANAKSGVFVGPVTTVASTHSLFRTLVPVLALAIFFAVAAVAILELLSGTRRGSGESDPAGQHTVATTSRPKRDAGIQGVAE